MNLLGAFVIWIGVVREEQQVIQKWDKGSQPSLGGSLSH